MIDARLLRDDPDSVRRSLERRGESTDVVDALIAADERRRSTIAAFEEARAEQKRVGKQVARAQGEEKQALIAQTRELAAQVKSADTEQADAGEEFESLLSGVPNLADERAPAGGEESYRTLEHVGRPRDFAAEGFEPKDHIDLGLALGAFDLERGAKVSGSRFYYLTGIGARLELALVQLAMDSAARWGFTPMIPPALVKPEAMDGTGFLGQAADDVYHLERDDLYLVGTSEVALAGYHAEEILDAESLPRKYAAFSPCYRREAGSHGKDTRGIFRVHWFDKVEMFAYTTLEESYAVHDQLLAWEKEWLDALEIPYRVIDTAAGDLGLSAVRKFDCEAWIPSQERYREVSSTSNCTQFQARRLRTRLRTDDGTVPAATLNGTLMASTRTIIALLENHQRADGSVAIPSVLRPYLGGQELIEPVSR